MLQLSCYCGSPGAKMAAVLRKSPICTSAFNSIPKPISRRRANLQPSILHQASRSRTQLPCFYRLLGGMGGLAAGVAGRNESGFGSDISRIGAVSGGGGGDGRHSGRGDGSSGGGGGGDDDDGDNVSGDNDSSIFSWYLMALDKYPVATKAITSSFLTLIGDLMCQLLIDRVTNIDLKRTLVFTFLGLVLVGPTLHFWYLSLSKLVTMSGTSGVFLRLLLDQFVFSPIFLGVFLGSLVTLEGRPSQVIPKLQQEWFSSVLANWQLWIPFQFLNFRFVPQNFQVLAANVVALAWNVILSYKAHKEVVVK